MLCLNKHHRHKIFSSLGFQPLSFLNLIQIKLYDIEVPKKMRNFSMQFEHCQHSLKLSGYWHDICNGVHINPFSPLSDTIST